MADLNPLIVFAKVAEAVVPERRRPGAPFGS
jgi:hypothetical protein